MWSSSTLPSSSCVLDVTVTIISSCPCPQPTLIRISRYSKERLNTRRGSLRLSNRMELSCVQAENHFLRAVTEMFVVPPPADPLNTTCGVA